MNIRIQSSLAAVVAAGCLTMCAQGAFAAGDQSAAAAQLRGATISADIKGFGRDGSWQDGGWRAVRDQQPGAPIAASHALSAPELGSSLTASALGLLVGGLVVMRSRARG